MSTEEQWRKIPGVPSHYEVSDMGRIKSIRRKITRSNGSAMTISEKVMSCNRTQFGYLGFTIRPRPAKGPFKMLVHRAVSMAFVLNPQSKRCVNHKDGNKTNNAVDNLEWVTYRENSIHRVHVLYHESFLGENNPNSIITAGDVIAIRRLFRHLTAKDIAPMFGIGAQAIYSITSRRNWSHIT